MDLRHRYLYLSSPKFRITYNLNGGSNSGSSLNVHELKESGEFLNDGATLTNTGFVFAGWNTASDGSGTNYPIVSTIPFTPPTGKTIFKAILFMLFGTLILMQTPIPFHMTTMGQMGVLHPATKPKLMAPILL